MTDSVEVVKAVENGWKIVKWIKYFWNKIKGASVIFILLSLYGCADIVKFLSKLDIPEPPVSTPAPEVRPTPIPTSTPEITPTPTSTPNVKKPVVAFWKVGGLHQPIEQYRCQNPQDGPKFQNQNICNVGSTTYHTCNPEVEPGCDQRIQGPCDPDHPNSFCYGRLDWDDYRGPVVDVRGAEKFEPDPDNAYNTLVTFIPGQVFTICTRARADYHTPDGIYLETLPNTETCTQHRYK